MISVLDFLAGAIFWIAWFLIPIGVFLIFFGCIFMLLEIKDAKGKTFKEMRNIVFLGIFMIFIGAGIFLIFYAVYG